MSDALYVCENCGLLGPLYTFNGDCKPGRTHGKLIEVKGPSGIDRDDAMVVTLPVGEGPMMEVLDPDNYVLTVGPRRYVANEQHYPTKGTVVLTIKRGEPGGESE